MKTIDNYINERLNPRHLGSTGRFPIDGTVEEVIEFLEKQHFEYFETGYGDSIIQSFDKENIKGYHVEFRQHPSIWFADTSKDKISRDNPVFLYKPTTQDHYSTILPGGIISGVYKHTKKEYLELLNKKFGWI